MSEEILKELIKRYPELAPIQEKIWDAYKILQECYSTGGKLLIAGNGGSAADAEHMVGELMKAFVKPRKLEESFISEMKAVDLSYGEELGRKLQGALPAIAVVDHVALSTAYLNDVDPLLGFAQQVYGYGQQGDVLLAISTSGNSKNVLYASVVAKAKGMKIVGLTGNTGGKLKGYTDVNICVPQKETYKIQELHLPIYHALCLMLEEHFFPNIIE